ncbi:MAG: sugar phosphate isomerase/epimerase family protein [Promethearchaeota archaeon]|jgi:sugar phosphate isomerase/epimerase
MQISCSTVCLVHLPTDQALKKIATVGFKNLELLAIRGWIGEYIHIDAQKTPPKEVRRLCKNYNLRLTALHAGGLKTFDDQALRESVEYIKLVSDMAEKLDVEKVVFTGGTRIDSHLTRYISGLKDILDHIEGKNIKICIENHYHNQIETIEDMQLIAEELPHPQIGLTIDTGHFTSSKISLDDVIKKLGPRIKHVHIKDHEGTQSVGLGRGETKNIGFVKKLKNINYRGELSMELEVEDKENIDLYLREGIMYMKELLS